MDQIDRGKTCADDNCGGVCLVTGGRCWAHADEPELEKALKRLGEDGELDARGVPITDELLERMLAAAPHNEEGHAMLAGAAFDKAIFGGTADFTGVIFNGATGFTETAFSGNAHFYETTFSSDVHFDKATFGGEADFNEATFSGDAYFYEVTFSGRAWFAAAFSGGAWFGEATFSGDAHFGEAAFSRGALFDKAAFSGEVWFLRATFSGEVRFLEATLGGEARFDMATFSSEARFSRTAFSDDVHFDEATFSGDAIFYKAAFGGGAHFGGVTFKRGVEFKFARFELARVLGPVLAYRGLVLDDTWFAQPVRIEASTPGLCCRRARFSGGAQFWLRWARVILDDAEFAGPSTVTGILHLSDDQLAASEQRIARAWQRLWAWEISERPQLLSLQRANVAGLGLSRVDLSDCRFAGAHNLDKLRIDADVLFMISPTSLKWDWRTVIAEELTWRSSRSSRWLAPSWPLWAGDEPPALEAGQIAELYRSLRKGREDSKDEHGAGVFYYGEMQMRRGARSSSEGSRGRVERSILTVYWLVSGYGTTAWRAVAWLGALIAGFAAAFHLIGFARPPQPSYWASLLYAFRATVSLTDNRELTAWGELLQALLRLSGPILLGLALLALRSRVKR